MVSFSHFFRPSFNQTSQIGDDAALCKQIGQESHIPLPFIDKLAQLLSIAPTDPNYQIQLDELCREVTPAMAESLKKMSRQLLTQAAAQKTLETLSDAIVVKKKWQELKLNSQWIQDSYQDAAYLVKTKLIYSIIGFQNSTLDGLNQNEIKMQFNPRLDEKELWIKKEGDWVPVSQIRREIQWNAKAHALVSKNCEAERWSYFSGQGLIPIHAAYEKHLTDNPHYSQENACMHPVARLSPKEMNELLTHAKNFTMPAGIDLDKPSIKGAIQFVTHPETPFQQSYLQNLNAQMKVHCGIRLIMPNGDVYSFGFGGEFQEHLLKNKASQCLATINGQPKILDYMEFQKYAQRLVTTLPLNEAQAEKILEQLNFYRTNGVRFNILKQNCVRFGTHLLQFAGISLDTRISLLKTAWRSLPNVEHIPYIGKALSPIKQSGQKAWQETAAKIPFSVKQIFNSIANLLLYVPRQFITLLLNLGMMAVGGTIGSTNSSLNLEKNNSAGEMENFDVLISNLFDSDATNVYHSSIFIHWQLNQTTTEVYRYSGQPRMNLLPPESGKERAFSAEQKKKLQVIYQESSEAK